MKADDRLQPPVAIGRARRPRVEVEVRRVAGDRRAVAELMLELMDTPVTPGDVR